MNLALILDGVLILLLVLSIGYSAMLHRRLGILRTAQGDMQEMILHFNQATQRAEAGISGLRGLGEEINRQVDPKLEDARVLRDDLQLLVERGERAAEQLEQSVSAARKAAASSDDAGKGRKAAAAGQLPAKRGEADDPEAAAATSERVRPHRRSQREIELITALKSVGK